MLPTSRPFCPLPEVTQTDMKPVLSSLTENSKGAQGGVHLLLLPRLWGGQPWIQGLEEGPDIRTPHLQPNLRTGHNVSWKKRLAAPHFFRNVRQTFTRKKNPYSQSHRKAQSSLFYNLVICERHSKNLSKSYFHSHTGPLPEFGLVYESHSWKVTLCLSKYSEMMENHYRETLELKVPTGKWNFTELQQCAATCCNIKITPK